MDRGYIINGVLEFDRKEFEEFLFYCIQDNELYNLRNLIGIENAEDTEKVVKRNIKHHPLRLAREIFGKDNVVTFTRQTVIR